MATHSSVPAWRIPGMGEPGGLPSMGSHRVQKTAPYICVSLLSRIQGYYYHLSKFHIYALLLLLLSRFSCVQLCATPEMAAHQAPPSLGFSKQEHWSGVPFPSPIGKDCYFP